MSPTPAVALANVEAHYDGTTLATVDHAHKHFEQLRTTAAVPLLLAFFAGAPPAQLAIHAAAGRDLVLDLVPKTGPHLQWVIDPRDWHVKSSIVVEANGDATELDLFTPDDQAAVRPPWFVFDPATLPGYSHP